MTVFSGESVDVLVSDPDVMLSSAGPVVRVELTLRGKGGFLPGSFDGLARNGVVNDATGITGELFHGEGCDSAFLTDPAETLVVNPLLIPGYLADPNALTGLFARRSVFLQGDWLLAELYVSPDSAVRLDFTVGHPGTEIEEYVSAEVTLMLSGDANCDGRVDIDDFVILKQNYNTSGDVGWKMGDFTGNGVVDISDFVQLKQNYGKAINAAGLVTGVTQ